MKTSVQMVKDAEQPITEADIVNAPATIYVGAHPPDDEIVILVPLPSGKYARCLVEGADLEAALDMAREDLVSFEADRAEAERKQQAAAAEREPDEAAPDEVLPTNAEEQPTE
jgi:hypothetical protein